MGGEEVQRERKNAPPLVLKMEERVAKSRNMGSH